MSTYILKKKSTFILFNKAVGPVKQTKFINIGPTSIPESRVSSSQRTSLIITQMTIVLFQHLALSYTYCDHFMSTVRAPL